MKPEIITTKSGLTATVLSGDVRETLASIPDATVQTCVTSPPYFGLRDYGVDGQIGLEPTPDAYVAKMVEVFREVRRVIRDDGTLWLNLGDSYSSFRDSKCVEQTLAGDSRGEPTSGANNRNPALLRSAGLKHKDLIGIPWRVAFALQADGWYLRSDIIWHKPNPMPESVTDRPTKAHEYLFLLAKSERYFYDAAAIAEPSAQPERAGTVERSFSTSDPSSSLRDDVGRSVLRTSTRNKRDVWTVNTHPYPEAHFATFPPKLIEPCIKAGCPAGGTVLDPFGGSFTTAQVALELGCNVILCELNPAYIEMGKRRIAAEAAQGKLFG